MPFAVLHFPHEHAGLPATALRLLLSHLVICFSHHSVLSVRRVSTQVGGAPRHPASCVHHPPGVSAQQLQPTTPVLQPTVPVPQRTAC